MRGQRAGANTFGTRAGPLALVVAMLLLLAVAETAAATTYCVAPEPSCAPENTFGTVQEALDAADGELAAGHPGQDTVKLGAGIYDDGPFRYQSGDGLDLVGAGRTQTVLTMAPPDPGSDRIVLTLAEGFAQVSDLAISVPSNGIGLALEAATAERVDILSQPGATEVMGVLMSKASRFISGQSIVPFSPGSVAIGSSGSATVADSWAQGHFGVFAGADAGTPDAVDPPTTSVLRTFVAATCGVRGDPGGTTVVQSSIIYVVSGLCFTTPPLALLVADEETSEPTFTALHARHVTVLANGGWGALATATHADNEVLMTLDDSIVDGAGSALTRFASQGTVNIATDHSNYDVDSEHSENTDGGRGHVAEHSQTYQDPMFVDPSRLDFRLQPESPMIDSGNPVPLSPRESPTEFNGNPRILDGTILAGDESCVFRRDRGAFEFVPSTLLALATAPVTASVGETVTFDASPSCDPNAAATLSYSWAFEDGAIAGGAQASHTFRTPGLHRAAVQVTSSDGRTAGKVMSVMVEPAPPGPDPPIPDTRTTAEPADTDPPVARRIEVRPRAFRAAGTGASIARAAGALVRYRLSETANVRFDVERLVRKNAGGRRYVRVPGTFSHQGLEDSNKFRFTGRLDGRKLRPGSYRIVARPKDGAGNVGQPVRRAFRIVRR